MVQKYDYNNEKQYQADYDSSLTPETIDEPTTIDWTHNHGKFVHEFTWKRYNRKLREWAHSLYNQNYVRIDHVIALLKLQTIRLDKRVDSEALRAEKQETILDGKISAEKTRAENAEKTNGNLIKDNALSIQELQKISNTLSDNINANLSKINDNTQTINNLKETIDALKAQENSQTTNN